LLRSTSYPSNLMDDYSLRQKKVFTNWINHKLGSIPGVFVNDLFEDLKDGFVLYHLLEKLEGKDLKSLKQLSKGKMRVHHINNMNIVWKFLTQTVKIVAIGPNDVVDGHPTLILGLIWSVIVFFFAKDFGGLEDMAAIKNKTLNWLKKKTEHIPDLRIHNLTTDLQDGRVFLAVLNQVNPLISPYNPSSDPRINLQIAFESANELYSIPKLLDARDPGCCSDEKSVLPYLVEWMRKIPDQTVNPFDDTIQAIKDNDVIAKDNTLKLSAIPSIAGNKNAFQSAVDAVNLISKLLRSSPKKKDDRKSAASGTDAHGHGNVDGHRHSNVDVDQRPSNAENHPVSYSGSDEIESTMFDPSKYNLKIKILHPESDNVDPSGSGAPMVFAEIGGVVEPVVGSDGAVLGVQSVSATENSKPALLFITNYGTSDPTKDVEASLWASQPFQPVSTDSSITACGVASDKGSVISAIEAVKSLVSAFGNKVPVNLKILAISLPPSSFVPDLDDNQNEEDSTVLHPSKKLANFIDLHKNEILTPNVQVVLASKPGSFTKQLPDSIVGIFGGRGALQFDLTVELPNSTPTCALESFNSNSNPISVLSSAISKLLEESRSNTVFNFGPQSPESKSDEKNAEKTQYEVTELDRFLESPEVGAHFAKVFPSFQANQSGFSIKKLFSQTTLVPTQIFSSSTGNDQNTARDYIPKSATCTFNAVLPVSADLDVAYSTITSFIENYVNELNNQLIVSFSNVKKVPGWYSDPTTSLFASLSNSFKSSFNQEYRPFIPSCEPISSPFCRNLSQSFNNVPTFFISLNDPHSNIAGPNETVLLDDINGTTEALVRFTFGLATGNPSTSSSGTSNSNPKPVHPHPENKQKKPEQKKPEQKKAEQKKPEQKHEEHKHEEPKHEEPKHEEPKHEEHKREEQPEQVVEKQPEQVVEQIQEQPQEQVVVEQQPEQTQEMPQEEVVGQQPEQSEQVVESVQEQQSEQVQEQFAEQPEQTQEQVQEEKAPANEEQIVLETNTQDETQTTEPSGDEKIVDYAKEADDLFVEINEMRSNPPAYAEKIAHFVNFFHQKDENDDKFVVFKPENGSHIETFEGRATLENVLDILRSTPPLPLFVRHEGMDKASSDLIEDQLKSGITGHQGSDGSSSTDRISRYGQW
jgi:acetylornithine deacetylase/succinyl-diaminopimelate desuccinylase-like protein